MTEDWRSAKIAAEAERPTATVTPISAAAEAERKLADIPAMLRRLAETVEASVGTDSEVVTLLAVVMRADADYPLTACFGMPVTLAEVDGLLFQAACQRKAT